ncbi:MAG: pseudoazurin [Rhodobacteraceae bacterium]|nr:pseudoazurin [Paracoccaceae bacterium]
MRILAAVLALMLVSEARADDLVIDMTADDDFSVKVGNINVGQTVTWLPNAKGHNIEFAKGPAGANLPSKSKLSKEVSVKFTNTGVYLYWCGPHKDTGMLGLIVVGNDLSNLSEIAGIKISRQSDSVLEALIASVNR